MQLTLICTANTTMLLTLILAMRNVYEAACNYHVHHIIYIVDTLFVTCNVRYTLYILIAQLVHKPHSKATERSITVQGAVLHIRHRHM
jgi:hypothetical protein